MKYLECKYIKNTINHPVLSCSLPGTPLMTLVPSAPLELRLGTQAGAALLSLTKLSSLLSAIMLSPAQRQ